MAQQAHSFFLACRNRMAGCWPVLLILQCYSAQLKVSRDTDQCCLSMLVMAWTHASQSVPAPAVQASVWSVQQVEGFAIACLTSNKTFKWMELGCKQVVKHHETGLQTLLVELMMLYNNGQTSVKVLADRSPSASQKCLATTSPHSRVHSLHRRCCQKTEDMRQKMHAGWLWCARSATDQTLHHTLSSSLKTLACSTSLDTLSPTFTSTDALNTTTSNLFLPASVAEVHPNGRAWHSSRLFLWSSTRLLQCRSHRSSIHGFSSVMNFSSGSSVPCDSFTQPETETNDTSFDAAQERASTDFSKPVVRVTAGPGTGKTRVLVARVQHLVQKKSVRRERIAVLTFTRKAAAELKGRISTLLGPNSNPDLDMFIGSFHSLALQILE